MHRSQTHTHVCLLDNLIDGTYRLGLVVLILNATGVLPLLESVILERVDLLGTTWKGTLLEGLMTTCSSHEGNASVR